MVKQILIVTLLTLSSLCVAQSQSPSSYGGKSNPTEAVTLTGVKVVPISITNTDDFHQAFDITVNGKVVMETVSLGRGVEQTINVPVRLKAMGIPEKFKICSISKPLASQSMYRIKLCTVAKLLWVKK
ncbi:hypothetical protein [Vibrio sp. THAF190c]|uniref:hypothetical protein n=1 Tax=Vibrio sp. THAF190c TaxID=2587865 RepID=UPI0012687D4B|nr:hypothetical protein [Vibrio sp. THAF190c]QFT13490.1 hypothetical protein FIV04_26405 [Vibrio sp. THAF190c]